MSMFSFFKRKSKLEKLREEYESLMEKIFIVSKTNRRAGDELFVKAEEVMKKIEFEEMQQSQ